MKTVALLSGGKDSIYNMMHCVANGHDIVCIGHLYPPQNIEELDSYMYQSVGYRALPYIAQCLDLPLYSRQIYGTSKNTEYEYDTCDEDEVEDLYLLLKQVISNHSDLEAISVGAICSNYQRIRVEHVANRLGLKVLSYLWEKNQINLVKEMINIGIEAIVIKTATMGLTKKHLGQSIKSLLPTLLSLHNQWNINVAGEGGEYETLVLDCPLFKKKLLLNQFQCIIHRDIPDAPVTFLIPTSISLQDKISDNSWQDIILSKINHE